MAHSPRALVKQFSANIFFIGFRGYLSPGHVETRSNFSLTALPIIFISVNPERAALSKANTVSHQSNVYFH